MTRYAVPLLALALLTFGASACASPSTQLVVVVGTDLPVPDNVAAVRIRTLRADVDVQETLSSQLIMLTDTSTIPLAVAVEPIESMEVGRVIVEAEAQSAEGVLVVSRRATTEFVQGRQLELPLFLSSLCRRVPCPMNDTCSEIGCVSQEVPVDSLERFTGELTD